TDRVVQFLEDEDRTRGRPGADEGLFLRLLRRPDEAAAPLALPGKVRTAAAGGAGGLGFTPRQRAAHDAICRPRATPVWAAARPRTDALRGGGGRRPRRGARRARPAVPRPRHGVHARRHREPAAQARRAIGGAEAAAPRFATGEGEILADGPRRRPRRRGGR